MEILFNNKCLEYSKENHVEGAYRIHDFANQFENFGTMKQGEKYLTLLYSPAYIKTMRTNMYQGQYIAEVQTSKSMYEAACISVDLAVEASKRNAFAITRPPGHHASSEKAEGFCVFNNIAIATQYLLNKNKKVCIIDIDGHYGNGTAKIFKENSSVLYCSLHQKDTYPYLGECSVENEINFLIPRGSGNDVLIDTVKKFCKEIEAFKPDHIGISAGFDGYYKDVLLDLNFTTKGFLEVGKILKTKCKNIFCCLEGGYHKDILKCTLALKEGLIS